MWSVAWQRNGHSSCATRGHFRGGGAQSSGAFVISVSGPFSGTALSPVPIFSYFNFWEVWQGQGQVGWEHSDRRFGEMGRSNVRKPALSGGQHGLGGLGPELAGTGF